MSTHKNNDELALLVIGLDGATWNAARRQNAAFYTECLAGSGVVTPVERPGSTHVYLLCVVRTPRRDALQAHLRERGIGTGIHYPSPIYLQSLYADRGFEVGNSR